jgi:phosphotransferase system enzyme I (PtsI)
MRETVELKGRPASVGIACGPLIVLRSERPKRVRTGGDAQSETAAFEAAVAAAAGDILGLIQQVGGEAGAILAFQLAFLEDETLRSAVVALIESGMPADAAWEKPLEDEISGYSSSNDEYFRGRGADIADVRDRVLRYLQGGGESTRPSGAILVSEEIGPTLFLETDWSGGGGLLLTAGSPSSHVAMLARARGVPMVVGLGKVCLEGHLDAIIDGETGTAILSPGNLERKQYSAKLADFNERRTREEEHLQKPAVSADGVRIELLINVAGPGEVDNLDSSICDGIGLMRTEFLFRAGAPLPGEQEQYKAYRKLLEWAGNKPVTIRTFDVGGDKPIRGVTLEGEKNPFLGQRGVRLTLARPDIFLPQLKALARAAVHGRLKVMLPMVTIGDELNRSAQLLDEAVQTLRAEGIACARPPLGIMVEVPAVAIAPELFSQAAFFSIGSNDLSQYVTASARDGQSVSELNDPSHPAVLKLIQAVAAFGRERNIQVSLCGDMAADPRYLETLLRLGLRSISVSPSALARVKAALSSMKLGY